MIFICNIISRPLSSSFFLFLIIIIMIIVVIIIIIIIIICGSYLFYYYYYYYYYRCVKFVNLSMSSLGLFSAKCSTFLDMMNDIGIDKKQQHYIINKIINIAIRSTYFIFCCRNRNSDRPDLTQFWFSVFLWIVVKFFFSGFFKIFLWIIQSQTANKYCKLPIHGEIYDCTFQNRNKVSIIIIIITVEPRSYSQQWAKKFWPY